MMKRLCTNFSFQISAGNAKKQEEKTLPGYMSILMKTALKIYSSDCMLEVIFTYLRRFMRFTQSTNKL